MILDKERLPMRAGIFFLYDSQGIIDRYIPYMLRDLVENLSFLLVVVNGTLSNEGKKELSEVTPNIFIRDNIGFDVWAYKEGLEYIGWDKLVEYDEIVLMNHTNFGPVYPFRESFDLMKDRDVDFWGLTKHYGHKFDPYNKCKYGYIPAHIQSSFIAIRKSMLSSNDFRQYWDDMPLIKSYEDSICYHEAVFTKHFEDKGYKSDISVDMDDLAPYHEYPLMLYPLELIKNRRCPIFKRKSFFNHYEEFLDVSCGQSTWELYNFIKDETDYDEGMIWESILRTANMYDIKMRMQLNYILPTGVRIPGNCNVKIALFMHLYDLSMMDTCKRYAENMPEYADVFITTSSQEKKEQIENAFSTVNCNALQVIVTPNRGRDVAPFLIGLKNYVQSYDYICFIHDKQSKYDSLLIQGEAFAYKCYENVLSGKIFVENIIATFENNPNLGLLVPPPPNHGAYYYIIGNEWMTNYHHTKELAEALDLCVDVDPAKPPIAPFGSCFWFRPKALQPLFANPFSYEDFPPEPVTEHDGTLMHSIERIYPFVAQSEGYYSGWLMSDVFVNFEITNLYKQLRDNNVTLFWNFGIQDRHSLLHSVSTCKTSLEIMRQKIPFKEKMKIIVRKFLGNKGYDLLKKLRDKLHLWLGKRYEST